MAPNWDPGTPPLPNWDPGTPPHPNWDPGTPPHPNWHPGTPPHPLALPALLSLQPWHTTGQTHTGSTRNIPWESSAKAAEPADASDVIRGLIRELSDLNRLAMGARRGLELLRRPRARRGRRAGPAGSRWKEG
ncbi:break repair meiotic recombinase recruitment factor 1 [Passer domesticus]|uniref:break repair meiotic recombinase recruitment factor 1 n=1 Tax=Passer domesticus TaxID=48849 RepID=UPI0030FEC975